MLVELQQEASALKAPMSIFEVQYGGNITFKRRRHGGTKGMAQRAAMNPDLRELPWAGNAAEELGISTGGHSPAARAPRLPQVEHHGTVLERWLQARWRRGGASSCDRTVSVSIGHGHHAVSTMASRTAMDRMLCRSITGALIEAPVVRC